MEQEGEASAPSSSSTMPGEAVNDQLLLLALQERLAQQLRPPDLARLWQNMILGLPLVPNPLDLASCLPGTSAPSHPLFQHNLCAWPGCDQPCDSFANFITHLSQAHPLDERAASQMRQQIELVDTLEHRLSKERNRLQAMMQHLHMKHSPDTTTPALGIKTESSPLLSPKQQPPSTESLTQPSVSIASALAAATGTSVPVSVSVSATATATPVEDRGGGLSVARRSRVSDKSVLPISADIARNREFYRSNDVRPPYTYASLIRQAIMESPECQLTLNEIYQWFTETFAYFRRNAATWKGRRVKLFLEGKCFARVEQNVKGAVWTVDDSEFYRRRPQRSSTRSNPTTPMPEVSEALFPKEAKDFASETLKSLVHADLFGDMSLPDGSNPLALLSHAAASAAAAAAANELFIKQEDPPSPRLTVDESSPSPAAPETTLTTST